MANIITHHTNLAGGTVQTYAENGSEVVLDFNKEGIEPVRMTPLQTLGLMRVLEAALNDTQKGTFIPDEGGEAGA